MKKKKLVIYYKFFMTVSALKQMPFYIHVSDTRRIDVNQLLANYRPSLEKAERTMQ